MNVWRVALLLLLVGCATRLETVPLAEPQVMQAIRVDARQIAVALARGQCEAALPPAERLALVEIAAGSAQQDEFRSHALALRSDAEELVRLLRLGDRRSADQLFARLLTRCDECHARFRPGGVAGVVRR